MQSMLYISIRQYVNTGGTGQNDENWYITNNNQFTVHM